MPQREDSAWRLANRRAIENESKPRPLMKQPLFLFSLVLSPPPSLVLSPSLSPFPNLTLQASTFQKMAPAAITKVVGRQIIDSR